MALRDLMADEELAAGLAAVEISQPLGRILAQPPACAVSWHTRVIRY